MQIPVVQDLPGVGRNVHDHVEVLGLSWTTKEPISFNSLFDTFGPSSILQYKLSRQGEFGNVFFVCVCIISVIVNMGVYDVFFCIKSWLAVILNVLGIFFCHGTYMII